ncbi:hypothetical protein CRYUN_Cryun26dG0090800 [Craigia yunnanensis]
MATIPSAVIIFFLLGVVLAYIQRPKVVNDIKFGPSSMEVVQITSNAWKEGFIKGMSPQLPLSVLNSVIAVCKLSSDLFPGRVLVFGIRNFFSDNIAPVSRWPLGCFTLVCRD